MIPLRPYNLILQALGIPQSAEGILLAPAATMVATIDDLRETVPPVIVARAGVGDQIVGAAANHVAVEVQAAPTGRGIVLETLSFQQDDMAFFVTASDELTTVLTAAPVRSAWSSIATVSVCRFGRILTAALPADPFIISAASGGASDPGRFPKVFVPPGFRMYAYDPTANQTGHISVGWREIPT